MERWRIAGTFFFSFYGVVGVGATLSVSDDRHVLQGWLGAKQVLWFAFGQQERKEKINKERIVVLFV